MDNNNVHFSSKSDEWETPDEFFDQLNDEFKFDADLCCTEQNSKCELWVNKLENFVGFIKEGYYKKHKTYWMNPPYSRGLQKEMVGYAQELSTLGKTVVCLLPARTDTKLWHEFIWDGATHKPRTGVEVRLIKGRIKFELNGVTKDPAPFPSAIVIFHACNV